MSSYIIPDRIKPKPIQPSLTTLEDIEAIIAEGPCAILQVSGDCLEGVDVVDGGWVLVDFTRFPAPPRHKSKGDYGSSDLCFCYATFPGAPGPAVMYKEYQGVWGHWQMVGTRYKSMWEGDKLRLNCGMVAKRIFGVIVASYDRDGSLLWQRSPEEFPEKLGTASTIHGDVEPDIQTRKERFEHDRD